MQSRAAYTTIPSIPILVVDTKAGGKRRIEHHLFCDDIPPKVLTK